MNKIDKCIKFLDKFFFFCIISIAFLTFLREAVVSLGAKEWLDFVVNAGLSAAVAHAYMFDWRKKI